MVNGLSKQVTEGLKDVDNFMAISSIISSKKSEIIIKEKVRVFGATGRDTYGGPIFGSNFYFNVPTQSLHAYDEQVMGHRVHLPRASGVVKVGSSSSIDQDSFRGGRQTKQDKIGKIGWKAKELEYIIYE